MELNIKKIEDYLDTVKISARQFCVQIGISYSAWNTMKNTKSTSIRSLTKIAEFMKTDPSELFIGYKAPDRKPEIDSEELKFISVRMEQFIADNKISIAELAEIIHVPYRTLRYQITNNCIGTSTLAAVAKVFKNVNIGWFFTENQPYEVKDSLSEAAEPAIGYGIAQKILYELEIIKKAVKAK